MSAVMANPDQPPARRGAGPRALAAVIDRITRPLFGRRGFADGAVIADWPAIVGPRLAADSAPERIDFPRGQRTDGTLRLRVAGGSLATELQHLEPVLVERVNGYFGYRAVARVRLVQGPVTERAEAPPRRPEPETDHPDPDLAARLAEVGDPELRAALEALGRSLAARRDGRGTP